MAVRKTFKTNSVSIEPFFFVSFQNLKPDVKMLVIFLFHGRIYEDLWKIFLNLMHDSENKNHKNIKIKQSNIV